MAIEQLYNGFRSTVTVAGYTAGSGTLVCSDSFAAYSPTFTVSILHDNGDGTFTKKAQLQVTAVTTVTLTVASEGIDNNAVSGDIVVINQGARSMGNLTGRVLLKEYVFSGASSQDCPGSDWCDSLFDTYEIELLNAVLSTTAALRLRVSTDGGATYDSGANYNWASAYGFPSGGGGFGGAGVTSIQFRDSTTTQATDGSMSAWLKLLGPASGKHAQFLWNMINEVSGANPVVTTGAGVYVSTTPVNGFQFSPSTGTFTGTVRVYGVRK